MYLKCKTIQMVLLTCLVTAAFTTATAYACTNISSLPYTISGSGTYCLASQVTASFSGDAIAIAANVNDVSLDLAGYEISNTNTGNGYGVHATGQHKNIVVKNGRINGFFGGVYFEDEETRNTNVVIEGLTISGHTEDAVRLDGFGNVVRNCVIKGNCQETMGIVIEGRANAVYSNNITDVQDSGVHQDGFVDNQKENNVIENNKISGCGAAGTGGITADGGSALVLNNRVMNYDTCIQILERGKYQGNFTLNCTVPYNIAPTVTDAGNNW